MYTGKSVFVSSVGFRMESLTSEGNSKTGADKWGVSQVWERVFPMNKAQWRREFPIVKANQFSNGIFVSRKGAKSQRKDAKLG